MPDAAPSQPEDRVAELARRVVDVGRVMGDMLGVQEDHQRRITDLEDAGDERLSVLEQRLLQLSNQAQLLADEVARLAELQQQHVVVEHGDPIF